MAEVESKKDTGNDVQELTNLIDRSTEDEVGGKSSSEAPITKYQLTATYDDLVQLVGTPGRYQCMIFVLLMFFIYNVSYQFFTVTLYGTPLPHFCKLQKLNHTVHYDVNALRPLVYSEKLDAFVVDGCHMYVDVENRSLGVKKCDNGYEHVPVDGEWTLAAEWDLVCEKRNYVNNAQTVFFSGITVGGMLCGLMADKFGRKPVFLVVTLIQTTLAIAISFAHSFIMFTILRFLQGVFLQGMQTVMIIYVVELFDSMNRAYFSTTMNVVGSAWLVTMPLFPYLIKNWRYTQLIISLPGLLSIFLVWCEVIFFSSCCHLQTVVSCRRPCRLCLQFWAVRPSPSVRELSSCSPGSSILRPHGISL